MNLYGNNIGDEGLEGISPLCFSILTYLHLDGNGIGKRGCEVITHILQSDELSLVHVDFLGNVMSSGHAEILVGSLANNTTFEVLHLGVGDDNISCVGWESVFRLVCDTSSVSAK